MGPCPSALSLFTSLEIRLNPRMVMAVGRRDSKLIENALPDPSEMRLEITIEYRFGKQLGK